MASNMNHTAAQMAASAPDNLFEVSLDALAGGHNNAALPTAFEDLAAAFDTSGWQTFFGDNGSGGGLVNNSQSAGALFAPLPALGGMPASQSLPLMTPPPTAGAFPPPLQGIGGGGATSVAVPAAANTSQISFATEATKKPPMTTTKKRKSSSSSSSSKLNTMVAASTAAVSEDEGDREKRRSERNLREQQRSHQITKQIDRLKELLQDAQVPFKPDKYSTLVTTGQYISQLQEKSSGLDSEHRRLLDTISKTTNAVNGQYARPSTEFGDDVFDEKVGGNSPLRDESANFVSELDYKSIFAYCPIPCAITSIDGRFLDCNKDFEETSGYSKADLMSGTEGASSANGAAPIGSNEKKESESAKGGDSNAPPKSLSLFNVLLREDMERVFLSMSKMLRKPFALGGIPDDDLSNDYFNDKVGLSRKETEKVTLNVTLVRGSHGRPKFFCCTLTPT